MLEHIIQLSLEILKKCAACEQPYVKEDIRLIRSGDSEAAVYVRCAKCESGLVWFIAFQPFGGMVWFGTMTDLSLEEVKKFERGMAISEDDVLRVHELLHTKDAGAPAFITSFQNTHQQEHREEWRRT